jgi:hypothetical protein
MVWSRVGLDMEMSLLGCDDCPGSIDIEHEHAFVFHSYEYPYRTFELVSRFGLYGRLQQGMCRPLIHRIARLEERERV